MTSNFILGDEGNGFVRSLLGTLPAADLGGWELTWHYFEPLAKLYLDQSVTEIMVDRYDRVRIERKGRLEDAETRFASEQSLQRLISQIASRLNQPVGDDHPILDARFPDGSRLCCTWPAVTPGGSTITIRCKRDQALTLEQLVSAGALTDDMAACIVEHVVDASTLLVSGGTSSGKTTILRAAAMHIPRGDRVITAEDTLELNLGAFLPGVIAHEAPKRRADDKIQAVRLQHLIKTTLRERPDRVWVGEIRDAEAANAFLEMGNTGHTGGASTIHANSPADAVRRIQILLAADGLLSYELAGHQVLNVVQLFIQAKRHRIHGRRITEIAVVDNGNLVPLYRFNLITGQHEKLAA